VLGTTWADDAGRDKEENAKIARAKINIKALTQALQVYKVNKSVFPTTLEELTEGERPIVKKETLVDPWGRAYLYDPAGPKNGGDLPDIWTVTPGKVVIGNWPEKKKK